MENRLSWVLVLTGGLFGACAAGACGSTGSGDSGADGGASDSGFEASLPFVDDGGGSNYSCSGCPTFPSTAPTCDPAVLGPPTMAYPTDGILLPPNLNVLEVQFVPPQGATLFEVDFWNGITEVKVETQCSQVPDVRGGTSRGCGITLPQAAWNDIANKNRDGDALHVTVRATKDGTCVTQSQAKVDLFFAKEDLAGGIYYWQSATFGGIGGKTGGIYSHDFGTFDPTPTPFYTSGSTGTCVGCHNLSRDGARISLATDDPDGDDEFGDVHTHLMDVATRTVVGGATMSPGFQTFTHDHAKMIASTWKKKAGATANGAFDVFDGNTGTLLTSMSLGTLKATQPDLSRDDQSLVFVVPAAGTISPEGDHHFTGGSLYTATFDAAANTMGAPAQILPANDRNYYYPSYSPNGTFLIFNDAPQPGDTATSNNDAFYNRGARVKLLHNPPAAGAQPIDLPALNVADGLTNSWPRWSPFVTTYKGHKLLWVTFSSNRDYGLHLVNKGFDNCYPPEGPAYDQPQPLSKQGVTYANCAEPQIWMAGVLVDEDGTLDTKDRSFPAFWLPFQDVTSHNHSAQWVEKVQGPGETPDGGTDAGACVASGGTCGGTGASCCSDTVCCAGACAVVCVR